MSIFMHGSLAKTCLAASLAATCLAGAVESVSGQYYYQPAPDYYHNDTASDTVVGGALGAITGAVVGGSKHRGGGALIGAGVGALTGNVLGQAKDRADERQAATGAAIVAQANQQATAQAVTNADLVGMARGGVSDDLIISTMRSRGARLDLGPQSLISMKQSGVSDRVLLAAQGMNGSVGYAPPIPGAVPVVAVAPPPTAVIVEPWPRYGYYPYHPYYHGHVYYRYR